MGPRISILLLAVSASSIVVRASSLKPQFGQCVTPLQSCDYYFQGSKNTVPMYSCSLGKVVAINQNSRILDKNGVAVNVTRSLTGSCLDCGTVGSNQQPWQLDILSAQGSSVLCNTATWREPPGSWEMVTDKCIKVQFTRILGRYTNKRSCVVFRIL